MALEELKSSLIKNAVLAYYEVSVEAKVVADISPVGLCAVLTQRKRGGYIRVI